MALDKVQPLQGGPDATPPFQLAPPSPRLRPACPCCPCPLQYPGPPDVHSALLSQLVSSFLPETFFWPLAWGNHSYEVLRILFQVINLFLNQQIKIAYTNGTQYNVLKYAVIVTFLLQGQKLDTHDLKDRFSLVHTFSPHEPARGRKAGLQGLGGQLLTRSRR